MSIILASQSPRRRELLGKITSDFQVHPFTGEETMPAGLTPRDTVACLARLKARAVAKDFPGDVVIGADTVVAVGDKILGKPHSRQECVEMLESLSGRSHSVFTGVAVAADGVLTELVQESLVIFYPLSNEEIEAYADMEEPYDKAGAYGIQGHAALFVEKIEGDYFNIMGLPVAALYRHLRARGLLFPASRT